MTMQSPPQPDTAVALIQEGDDGLHATGAFGRFRIPFTGDAAAGDLLLIDRADRTPSVIRRLGRPSSVHAVIEALALDGGAVAFTDEQERRAQQLADMGETHDRADLTSLPTFTIDGDSTKDFDDAISARVERGGIRVWVHVADVAAYVTPGSEFDIEACRRGTSLYLPTMTVPMLPNALSTGVCSLQPGVERAAVTCEMLVRDGAVTQRKLYRSKIRSGARLTYDHVDQVFLGRLEPGPTYKAALAAARQAADTAAGPDERVSTERQYVIDHGEVVAVNHRAGGESHLLIERLMVLANRQVAAFLRERGVPTLYRTHALTSPERLSALTARLTSLGLCVNGDTFAAAEQAVDEHESRHGRSPAIRGLLMGARQAAAYQRDVAGHDGLDLDEYCHFTSPIRRYADLVVHRALLAEIGSEPAGSAPRYVDLPELGEHLTGRTLHAKRLERRAGSICEVSWLRHRIKRGEIERHGAATVTGMTGAGCFAELHGVEGMIPAFRLGGAPNEQCTRWKGRTSVKVGDEIAVRIVSLDPVRGRVSLAPSKR